MRAAWPTLPADERQLILDRVWATAGEDSALADVIDDLEATLAFDGRAGESGDARPWETVNAEIEADGGIGKEAAQALVATGGQGGYGQGAGQGAAAPSSQR